jgi:hypothetical protein
MWNNCHVDVQWLVYMAMLTTLFMLINCHVGLQWSLLQCGTLILEFGLNYRSAMWNLILEFGLNYDNK